MIIGYFIEYIRAADFIIFAFNMFILVAKIFDIVDLYTNKRVADPSLKYKNNIYTRDPLD